jgi:hypothetical protein
MQIRHQHERIVAAAPERITELIADFDRIWPTQIAPAPRLLGHGTYHVGIMAWEEFDRPGAARAFRVTRPDELRAEHWFELRPADLPHAGLRRRRRRPQRPRQAAVRREHCESGARTLFHQRAFDWLDAVLKPRADEPGGVSGVRDRALLTPPA